MVVNFRVYMAAFATEIRNDNNVRFVGTLLHKRTIFHGALKTEMSIIKNHSFMDSKNLVTQTFVD